MKTTTHKTGTMHSSTKVHACIEKKLPHTGDYLHLLPICKTSTKGYVSSAFPAPEGKDVDCLRCLARLKKIEEKAAKKAEALKAADKKTTAASPKGGKSEPKDPIEALAETCDFVVWDWRDNPSANDVNEALTVVGKSHKVPTFYEVGDTGGDQCAWVVGPDGLMPEVVQLVFLKLIERE